MLELRDVKKEYDVNGNITHALKGINVSFRKSEFVAILGPSGCGKTTMLNLIGGLDRYTSGDIKINGVSTKEYKNEDWDSYRNHSIGFVFQNYNLISHQNIVRNVELSLSLSGVKDKEKRQRAIQALDKVGLSDHVYKKPNQLSGGQMQRVAIARALVNNPEIILADEPTGALDTETGLSVMELLKEISKDKLVIMVTHNPQLAAKYATRTISLIDGEITSDSNPYTPNLQEKKPNRIKKTSMKLKTAFTLSFRNLLSKKGRTILTSIAGSIGIIGIALILSLSSGLQLYIDNIQRDTLSEYPVSIARTTSSMENMMSSLSDNSSHINDTMTEYPSDQIVRVDDSLLKTIDAMNSSLYINDLASLKTYLDANVDMSKVSAIQYAYDFNLNVYSNSTQVYPMKLSANMAPYEQLFSSYFDMLPTYTEMMNNTSIINEQYDVLAGTMPVNATDIVIVVDKYNRVSDLTLCALGLKDYNEIIYPMMKSYLLGAQGLSEEQTNMMLMGIFGKTFENTPSQEYTFNQLLSKNYNVLLTSQYYKKTNGVWTDYSKDIDYVNQTIENSSLNVDVVGIIRLKESVKSGGISGSIGYTSALRELIEEKTQLMPIVIEHQSNPTIDVFTNQPFAVDNNYQNNSKTLDIISSTEPSAIHIYPTNFENKDYIKSLINEYNLSVSEDMKIKYTDVVDLLMSSVTTIINSISYVLIAFVSISLVVSSIMIGIITYVSVIERTKEIGILRSVGARKKDISRVFNAETFVIGLTAGLFGILFTLLVNAVIINPIIASLTGTNIVAVLPLFASVVLVTISVLMTMLSGLIPAMIASNKDPVVALRTE